MVLTYAGQGGTMKQTIDRPVVAAPGAQTLCFPLLDRPVVGIEIQPLNTAGTIVFRSLRVARDRDGYPLRAFEPERLQDVKQIQTLRSELEGLEVVTSPNADDPWLRLILDAPIDLTPSLFDHAVLLLCLDLALFAGFYALVRVACLGWARLGGPSSGRAVVPATAGHWRLSRCRSPAARGP